MPKLLLIVGFLCIVIDYVTPPIMSSITQGFEPNNELAILGYLMIAVSLVSATFQWSADYAAKNPGPNKRKGNDMTSQLTNPAVAEELSGFLNEVKKRS
jgi:hypothetical protein